jgi:WD40 repeat protein
MPITGDGETVTASVSARAPDNLQELPTVAGYELLEVLGRGGMGVVYKARQQGLHRLVALKMILAGGHASANDLARFRSEAETVACLQHPNIVQIHEIAESEGRPFFSLEFVSGGSLADQLDGTPLPPRQAAEFVGTVAHATHAAHQAGVVHRDLKPANILLARGAREPAVSGRSGPHDSSPHSWFADAVPKITDFGLAKQLDSSHGQTQTGAILGTPSYMAPEQASGHSKSIGPATDVYALGAILYELLTGRPPFKAPTPLDTILQVVTEEPAPPSQLQPKIPRDLETIALKCLQKDPRKRYLTARDLANDLRHFLNGEPIQARPVGQVERLGRWARRNPYLAVVGGLAAVSLFAVAVVSALFARHYVRTADDLGKAADDLRREQSQTLAALDDSRTQRQLAEERALLAKTRLAENYLDQGIMACSLENDPAKGLLLMARAEEIAPRTNVDLDSYIRTQLAAWNREVHSPSAALSHHGLLVGVGFLADRIPVAAMSYSLTGGDDKTARLWHAITGKPASAPLPHRGAIRALDWSPDGQAIVTGGDDMAYLWEVTTGKLVSRLQHQGAVYAIAFSSDGKTVITGSQDKSARLWETATGKAIMSLEHQEPVNVVAISPDGKTLATGGGEKTAKLWDAATGKLLARFEHQSAIVAVTFSPDGKTVMTGSDDTTARLWETAKGGPLGAPMRHSQAVRAIAFSPDGKTVISCSWDKTARLWDSATGNPLGLPLVHQGPVGVVGFSSDGKMVVTGSDDKTARLWEVPTGKVIGPPLRHQHEVVAVAFSPDSKSILTGSLDNSTRLWMVATPKTAQPTVLRAGAVAAVAFSPDGKTVLTGEWDGTARFWDVSTGKVISEPLKHGAAILSVAFSPDGQSVLTGSNDSTARLWQTGTGRHIGTAMQHITGVTAVAFSPDGKTLLTGEWNGKAQFWEASTGMPIGDPLQHRASVIAVAYSADGKTALTASRDATARRWDVATREAIGPPINNGNWESPAVFSPDRLAMLTASADNVARLWELASGKDVVQPMQHDSPVSAVAFSADGKTMATASQSGTVHLWHVATGKAIGPPLQHEGPVRAAAFSPNGQMVVTGSEDKTVRLWEVPSPVRGNSERINLWVQVLTGQELDEHGVLRALDASAWHERRQHLENFGEPPTG